MQASVHCGLLPPSLDLATSGLIPPMMGNTDPKPKPGRGGSVKHQPEPPSRISRNRCQGSAGTGVKDQPEQVSRISRNSVKDQVTPRRSSGRQAWLHMSRDITSVPPEGIEP